MDTSQAPCTFTVEPKSVGPEGNVTVSWSHVTAPSNYGWVGLYTSADSADNGYVTYKYITPTESGSITFTMPEKPGATYEFRYFPSGAWDKKGTSEAIVVNPPPPVHLVAEPRDVGPEGEVTVTWKDALKASAGGWIGLYANSAAADNGYLSFKYLSAGGSTVGADGSLRYTMPEDPSASYEFRIFPIGGYDKRATTQTVTVDPPPPVKLHAEPQSVCAGENVTVSWSDARKANTSGWIALYASGETADNGYVTYKNITATDAGSLTFTMPQTLGANYEFRIFPRGGWDRKAVSGRVEVQDSKEKALLEATQELAALKQKYATLEVELASKERQVHALQEQVQKCADCEAKLVEQTHTLGAMEQELKKHIDEEARLAKQLTKLAELEAQLKRCADCEAKLDEKDKLIAILEHKLEAAAPKPQKKPDDLKVVEGIGPKIAELLHDAGIVTFKDLASAEVSRLKDVLAKGGPRFSVADPSTWPEQAKHAAAGHWDDLNALQAKLKAGRGA